MPLQPGSRIGPYEVISPIGAGGMGEVWLATELRLGRRVALKLLPADLTRDPARIQRFEQEARAASALNHPNVCTIHALDQTSDGQHYIAMEYVEGETLRQRLATSRLSMREALEIAIPVAAALNIAHAAGIVHRDIKPENVMLRPDGVVKVLDFGLAKLTSANQALDAQSTQTAFRTDAGTVVGTIAYMSPEQARGQQVDARTDIWALGCVLYEMVAGRSPFLASSSSDVLAAILDREPPPVARFEPEVPGELQRILTKALRKDRTQRYQSVQDLLLDVQALRDDLATFGRSDSDPITQAPAPPGGPVQARSTRARRRVAVGLAVAIVGGVGAAGWWWTMRGAGQPATAPAAASVQRNLTRLTFGPGLQTDPAFSPDGRFLAFAADRDGNFDIYVLPLSGGDPIRVTKSPAADTQPNWSPDGTSIAFRSERDGGGIYIAPAFGGAERRLVGEGSHPWWTPDGGELHYLLEPFGNSSCVLRAVPTTGGAPRNMFPAVQGQGPWLWIGPAPNGRTSFLGNGDQGRGFYTVSEAGVVQSDLTAVRDSLATVYGGQASIFAEGRFQWNADGSALLLQTRSADGIRNLWRVSVDAPTLKWTRIDRLTTGSDSFVGGTYAPGSTRIAFSIQEESEQLWEYTVAGTALSNGRALSEDGASALGADASQDGHTIIFQLLRPGGPPSPSFWVIRRGQPASEIPGVQGLYVARLSPDGSRFAYLKLRPRQGGGFDAALATQNFNGSDQQIAPWGRGFGTPSDWSSDGKFILTGGRELRSWPVEASPTRDESRIVLTASEGNLWEGRYSPNGRWIAFVNSQRRSAPDRCAIGVVPADGSVDRQWIRVAPDRSCADKPRWNRDGKALYFLANEGAYLQVWRVPFDAEGGRPTGPPVRLSRFDSPGFKVSRSLSRIGWGLSDRKAYVTMTSTAGSIWMLDNVDK